MLTEQTITHLRTLKLDGMVRAFEEQLGMPIVTVWSAPLPRDDSYVDLVGEFVFVPSQADRRVETLE